MHSQLPGFLVENLTEIKNSLTAHSQKRYCWLVTNAVGASQQFRAESLLLLPEAAPLFPVRICQRRSLFSAPDCAGKESTPNATTQLEEFRSFGIHFSAECRPTSLGSYQNDLAPPA